MRASLLARVFTVITLAMHGLYSLLRSMHNLHVCYVCLSTQGDSPAIYTDLALQLTRARAAAVACTFGQVNLILFKLQSPDDML